MFFQKLADANQITFLDGADSWQEAVQLSCQSLVTNGAVDADYADQVIACVEKYAYSYNIFLRNNNFCFA